MPDNITKDRSHTLEKQEQERRNPRDRGDDSRSYRHKPGDAGTDKKTGAHRTASPDAKRTWNETDKAGNKHTKTSETVKSSDASSRTSTTKTTDSWTDKKTGDVRNIEKNSAVTKRADGSSTTSGNTKDETSKKDGSSSVTFKTHEESKDRKGNSTGKTETSETRNYDKWGLQK